MMYRNKILLAGVLLSCTYTAFSQKDENSSDIYFVDKKTNAATPIKNQAMTGTCWCFSTASLLESECLVKGGPAIDLSEMFTVRNIYIDKAKNYILRQGHAQFGQGGLGHDEINAVAKYGAMPEDIYSGLLPSNKIHNHTALAKDLQTYVDSLLKIRPLPGNWLNGYIDILDKYLGAPPAEFDYNGKHYTPQTFAKQVLDFKAEDYVFITSFTHHPFYTPFILEAPDNFSNGSYYNLPLNEMTEAVKTAIQKGYTVMWDADVSNPGFRQREGLALNLDETIKYTPADIKVTTPEMPYDSARRQRLYENLTTEDDHLMHITGTEKTREGKSFFIVKNSWGEVGPYKGYINVSEAYFAINTVSLIIPKAGMDQELLNKLHLN